MKRYFTVYLVIVMTLALLLCGCESGQIDRTKELEKVMDTCDSKWSQAFPTGSTGFEQTADFIAGWGGNAGLEVTKNAEHYLVLTNPATKGMKKTPSVTLALTVDPTDLRDSVPLLSLGMTSVLGPVEHGRIRLIVAEATEKEYPGADAVSSKYLKCDHFIDLNKGGSNMVYTAGPMSAEGRLSCNAGRTKPEYTNAFKISIQIPEDIDPYSLTGSILCRTRSMCWGICWPLPRAPAGYSRSPPSSPRTTGSISLPKHRL